MHEYPFDAVDSDPLGLSMQYVLISDVHLTEICASPTPGWWTYKRHDASQDAALVDFMAFVDAQCH